MKIIWNKSRCEEIDIKCPICGHQTAPPKYPYCSHTIFVFVDPTADDAFLDFMRSDFAEAWRKAGKKIPTKKILSSFDLLESCEILEVNKSTGYYPTRIVVGYEKQENRSTQSAAGDAPKPRCLSPYVNGGEMTTSDRERIIKEIQSYCRGKVGNKKGLIVRYYEGIETGIRTYNYDVISKEGFFSGYWTDRRPKLADRTIVSRIIDTEECQEWNTLDDQILEECLCFLQTYLNS